MEFTKFKRRPFEIEAVQITNDNIEELAELIGELINDVAADEPVEPYIRINKRIVPNINRAYVGWWVTRMGDNIRCYAPKVFDEQFEPSDDAVAHNVFTSSPTST